LFVIGFYFHSAVTKFDYSFLHTLGQQFLDALAALLGTPLDDWSDRARFTLAAAFPAGELAIAVGLCFAATRRVALAAALLLHGTLLLILGPWGLGHKPGVLIWNVFFIVQDVLLFGASLPSRRDTALVALHTLLGLGLAIGPLVASPFIMSGRWAGFPLLLAALCALLAAAVAAQRFPRDAQEPAVASGMMTMSDPMPLPTMALRDHPARTAGFWLFTVIAVLYAFAEGTFGNWAVLYLQDVKHLPETVAASALSVFWAAMVGGRLLTSVLVLKLAPRRIWLSLPGLMVIAFLLLPYADTPMRGIAGFALAGIACSAFFPLSIGLASQRFEKHVPWVSSMLIAALMVGVGLGSYLIGLLRDAVAMEQLYRLSTFYPIAALLLGIAVLRRRSRSALGAALRH